MNKFLALSLGISRRQADDLIAAGQVVVNNTTAILGQRITPNDKVYKNSTLVNPQTNLIYLIFNKPVGYLSSRKSQGKIPTLYELLPKKYQNLKSAGRLDKDSSGLILLTNDGDFAYQMTHPKFAKTKIYKVTLDKPLTSAHQRMITGKGIDLPDGKSQLGLVESALPVISSRSDSPSLRVSSLKTRRNSDSPETTGSADSRTHWQVTMSEGRNRQIRRTFAALGYNVTALHRTQFGKYQLGNLKSGQYQEVGK
ncbi:pseudouridine synthase [Candidatus Saccharibacteria bacterium]|nr:pseudouridine synthase [Candidatus Saccharibacteria bacterium]